MDPIWTQSDIDALKTALKSGVLLVRYNGPPMREVQYQSLGAMRDLLAEMVADVNGPNGTNDRRAYRIGITSKGL